MPFPSLFCILTPLTKVHLNDFLHVQKIIQFKFSLLHFYIGLFICTDGLFLKIKNGKIKQYRSSIHFFFTLFVLAA